MDAMPPPLPPVEIYQQSTVAELSQQDVEAAVQALRNNLTPRMQIESYGPSEYPGHVKVLLRSTETPDMPAQLAYTDKTGRYLILAVIVDTKKGAVLDAALEGRPQ